MLKRRSGVIWSALCRDADATQAFFLGITAALTLVLILELWLPVSRVEQRVLETAIQTMHERSSP